MLLCLGHRVENYGYSFLQKILEAEKQKQQMAVYTIIEAVLLFFPQDKGAKKGG